MDLTAREIASQPDVWEKALGVGGDGLPEPGERISVIGCGTSYYVAQSYSRLRELAGQGVSDACVASEFALSRPMDRVLAISRSGTTTEVVSALQSLPDGVPSAIISAVRESPAVGAASSAIVLEFADERSVVQTRFATATLALLRARLGHDLDGAIAQGRTAVHEQIPVDPSDFDRFVFLGRGWTIGLANEGALKMREAALAWSESYPAFEYRHGPISLADQRTLIWFIGEADARLVRDVTATGATALHAGLDPMVELVLIQRTAVSLAMIKGLDPDHPRNLTRSVVLS
jgi:fructoselysine-6-P-deglycase FrlB-like protein